MRPGVLVLGLVLLIAGIVAFFHELPAVSKGDVPNSSAISVGLGFLFLFALFLVSYGLTEEKRSRQTELSW